MRPVLLTLSLLVAGAAAHMPAGAGSGTREEPVDLGDTTTNSWALTGELNPGEVKHYKFTIASGATTAASTVQERFYIGMYVPGSGEPDFNFYVAVFGMNADTECERWGDGWGRRRLSGGDDHAHDHDSTDGHHGLSPHRITSEGTTWLMDSAAIPTRVTGEQTAHDHSAHDHRQLSGGVTFDYHQPEQTLTFIASPATDLPNKFEAFSPTLFKPRGSCIADFPRGGEYRLAVWGDASQTMPKKFSVGIGLAERDVFAPVNLMQFDYTLYDIQTWNHWNAAELLLPMILLALAALALLGLVPKIKPAHYGTASGHATPFRGIVLVASAVIIGHLITNIAILVWATSNAHAETRELIFPLILGLIMPLLSGTFTLLIGAAAPLCGCCCASARTAHAHWSHRIVVGLFGVLHLFLHCGYLVAPSLLMLAAILPPAIANRGIKPRTNPATGKGIAMTSSVGPAHGNVEETPRTSTTV